MNKSDLLHWLREEYRQWEALLDQIGRVHMERPGVNGDWSMKDIVAHLTGWNRWLVLRLQAAGRGEPEPPPPWPAHLQTDDEINAWIYESNRGRSLGEVLEESRQDFQQLLAVIEGLPEDVQIEHIEPNFHLLWVGEKRFPAGEFFDHSMMIMSRIYVPGWHEGITEDLKGFGNPEGLSLLKTSRF